MNTDELLTDYTRWKDWDAANFGSLSRGDARYFAWHLDRCHPAPVRRALEIGFGNGAFLAFARQRGIEATGIEIQPELRRRAEAAGFACHASLDELSADARFDLVVAFDVFEHVPAQDLPALLHAIADRLPAGGVLLCRVPNGESPFGRMFQHGDLTHCTTLGLSSLTQLGGLAGLQVACHGEWPWYRRATNPKRLLRAMLQRLIERAVAFAYHWDADALSPNLVVALRKPNAPRSP